MKAPTEQEIQDRIHEVKNHAIMISQELGKEWNKHLSFLEEKYAENNGMIDSIAVSTIINLVSNITDNVDDFKFDLIMEKINSLRELNQNSNGDECEICIANGKHGGNE